MDAAAAPVTPLKKTADPQQYPHTPEDLRKEASYPIWVRLRSGDRTARDELVVRYAPLVKYVIGRMAISLPAAMDSDDVLSAGTVGLLHAIDRFDPDQGVRFETYALQRIRGAIIDTIRSLSPNTPCSVFAERSSIRSARLARSRPAPRPRTDPGGDRRRARCRAAGAGSDAARVGARHRVARWRGWRRR